MFEPPLRTEPEGTLPHDSLVPSELGEEAAAASAFLKALGHEGRLMILCHLVTGEKSVGDLERLIGARQAAVSQPLARLRLQGLVTSRREGKAQFYALGDARVKRTVELIYEMFCAAK